MKDDGNDDGDNSPREVHAPINELQLRAYGMTSPHPQLKFIEAFCFTSRPFGCMQVLSIPSSPSLASPGPRTLRLQTMLLKCSPNLRCGDEGSPENRHSDCCVRTIVRLAETWGWHKRVEEVM